MSKSHVAGWTPEAPSPAQIKEFFSQIETGRVTKTRLQAFLSGDLLAWPMIDLDADPFVPDGWKVEEHIKGGQLALDPAKIGFYLSDQQQGGNWINGHKLREELKGKPVFNANMLDALLAHTEFIPEELKGKAVFFWGTIYRDSDARLCVRCLCWGGAQWVWDFGWLVSIWNSRSPAAVSASS